MAWHDLWDHIQCAHSQLVIDPKRFEHLDNGDDDRDGGDDDGDDGDDDVMEWTDEWMDGCMYG
jgi:hypothetical protein